MGSFGWIHTLAGSPIVDKEQTLQQMQAQVHQGHTEAQTLNEQNVRQTTITTTPDGEKVRMRQRRDKQRNKKRRRQKKVETEQRLPEGSRTGQAASRKRVDVTV